MAQRPRTLLINPSGRKLLEQLATEYPHYTWVLTMVEGKEICVGYYQDKPVVAGADYLTIKINMK